MKEYNEKRNKLFSPQVEEKQVLSDTLHHPVPRVAPQISILWFCWGGRCSFEVYRDIF